MLERAKSAAKSNANHLHLPHFQLISLHRIRKRIWVVNKGRIGVISFSPYYILNQFEAINRSDLHVSYPPENPTLAVY